MKIIIYCVAKGLSQENKKRKSGKLYTMALDNRVQFKSFRSKI